MYLLLIKINCFVYCYIFNVILDHGSLHVGPIHDSIFYYYDKMSNRKSFKGIRYLFQHCFQSSNVVMRARNVETSRTY